MIAQAPTRPPPGGDIRRALPRIGAHAPREERIRHLAGEIAKLARLDRPRRVGSRGSSRCAERDEAEEDQFGQDVRGTFPKADFFIDASHRAVAREQLERCMNAWFGDPFASPTPEEYAMFHAHAAGARSADLSRQVGAAIAIQGDIVAVGCNEVPAFGGGAYWTDRRGDSRDFMNGDDANARIASTTIEGVRNALTRAGVIRANQLTLTPEQFAAALEHTRIDQLTEFGRAVHAEMAAILDAARRGQAMPAPRSTRRPFPATPAPNTSSGPVSSRWSTLPPTPRAWQRIRTRTRSRSIPSTKPPSNKVVFCLFVGIAPPRYQAVFEMVGRRKTGDGRAVEFKPRAPPKLVVSWDTSYLDREGLAITSLSQELERHKVALIAGREIPAPQPR